ncbi:hypothetical protein DUZ99_17200 [Xylanibacillus composti]|uniref:Glycosyl transferase n=1 Tax=Xylanibacillus composti TaxID=1572762 RepID=A0A8J4M2W2_9BACL|nr:nucleotide disphospho-sugar-binding domain-containing protein [Xylanibacillus composti]MDT9726716.1 hypothetical protein [Xylanibacillus composti]GIQ69352.1 glycosyl transferase [Xylanibacillus composti]
MRHVFFGLSGGLGPILRNVPTAKEFERAGIEVSFSIYGEYGISLLQRLGLPVHMDDDPIRPGARYRIPPQPMFYHLDHYYAQMGLLDKQFTAAWVRNRIRMVEQAKADLIVSDMSPHTIIAAKVLGIPSIAITQSCLHARGKPLFWGHPPRNLPRVTPVINEILRSYRLPEISRMEELHSGDLDIAPSIPELDPIGDNRVIHAGPISMNMHETHRLELPDGQTGILVYPGRMRDASGETGLHLLRAVFSAFARKKVTVVVATSEALPASLLRSCPRNVRIVPTFNEDMLHRFDLFIHHGGHGSCLSAICQGVPSLMIPTQREREFNARQMHRIGAGEYMMPLTFTSAHLYGLSMYMLHEEYRERVRQLRDKVKKRHYGGARLVYEHAVRLQTAHQR